MTVPYWSDDLVTLYLSDCREVTEWLAGSVLVTDPPYGVRYSRGRRTWKNLTDGRIRPYVMPADRLTNIEGDEDTALRDWALGAWGTRPSAVFGSLKLAPPSGARKVLIYRKPPDSGTHGALGGFRHDIEGIYLLGTWSNGRVGGRSSIIDTGASRIGGGGPCTRYGHPHAKPVDVMETLIAACPPGIIADPFAGSGSTLIAARNQGRQAIGVEIDERYAEMAARRLAQGILTEVV